MRAAGRSRLVQVAAWQRNSEQSSMHTCLELSGRPPHYTRLGPIGKRLQADRAQRLFCLRLALAFRRRWRHLLSLRRCRRCCLGAGGLDAVAIAARGSCCGGCCLEAGSPASGRCLGCCLLRLQCSAAWRLLHQHWHASHLGSSWRKRKLPCNRRRAAVGGNAAVAAFPRRLSGGEGRPQPPECRRLAHFLGGCAVHVHRQQSELIFWQGLRCLLVRGSACADTGQPGGGWGQRRWGRTLSGMSEWGLCAVHAHRATNAGRH